MPQFILLTDTNGDRLLLNLATVVTMWGYDTHTIITLVTNDEIAVSGSFESFAAMLASK